MESLQTNHQERPVPEGAPEAIPRRFVLALAAIVLLALAMIPTNAAGMVGMYSHQAVGFAAAAGLCVLAACVLSARKWRALSLGRWLVLAAAALVATHAGFRLVDPAEDTALWPEVFVALTALLSMVWAGWASPVSWSLSTALLAALALVLTGEGVFFCTVAPRRLEGAILLVRVAACGLFAITVSLLFHVPGRTRPRPLLLGTQVALLVLAGTVLRCAAAVAAPDPEVDVYYAIQEATDHLLAGSNPYAASYRWEGAPFYPPLPFLVGLPVRAVGLDVRVALALCDVAAALALLAMAWQRGQYVMGALLAATYLGFPRVPLLLKMGWYEPVVAAFLGLGLALAERGWRLGYLLLGVGLTGKQYGVFLLPPLVKSLWPRWGAVRLGILLALAGVLVPFVLWDAQAFVYRVVIYHLIVPPRDDAITLLAAAKNLFGIVAVPPVLLLVLSLLVIVWIVWRTPTGEAAPAARMGAVLLIFCLFHSQAFYNYFYLCQYLLLVGLLEWSDGSK